MLRSDGLCASGRLFLFPEEQRLINNRGERGYHDIRPWKASNYLKIGHRSVFILFEWRFVVGITIRWEGLWAMTYIYNIAHRGMALSVDPFPSRCHRDSGIHKADSLLLQSYAKVSNTKDMLNRQTSMGILCLPNYTSTVTEQMASSTRRGGDHRPQVGPGARWSHRGAVQDALGGTQHA